MAELIVENLRVSFPSPQGPISVVDGVSFTISNERVGLVGESGSGKSMTARALLGLVRKPGHMSADQLRFDGTDLRALSNRQWQAIRGGQIAMVMQDPKYSLNPVQKVGQQIAETGLLHGKMTRREAQAQVNALLASVGIADAARIADSYPHQLSGGLGQRVMIAAMLAASPRFLIADEPTSALDVMVRGQVLDLLDSQIRQRNMGLLLISHDLAMVARYCDQVLIMYRGKIVERCRASELHQAQHPYTRGLLGCLPSHATRGKMLSVLDRDALLAGGL